MESSSSIITSILQSGIPLVLAAASYAFFIVSSFAIARSRLSRLEELEDDGAIGAVGARRILHLAESYLVCCQLGRFLSAVAAGFLLSVLIRDVAAALDYAAIDGSWVYSTLFALSVSSVFIGITLVVVQVAKTIAIQFPETALRAVSVPLGATFTLFGPIVLVVHGAVTRLLRLVNVKRMHEGELALSTDDLSELVRRGSAAGSIDKSEQELIEGIVELSESIVREVMTARTDIVYARETTSFPELVKLLNEHGVSRILICGKELDDVKGLVLAKDLIRFVGQVVAADAWKQFIRPAYFIPNTKPVNDLLTELQGRGVHMAVVMNEHGGVDGLVTLEDLVEEIIGEILDEHDQPEQNDVIVAPDGGLLAEGGVSIERLADEHSVDLPEGDYDTLAGFILAQLGRVPDAGDTLEVAGFHLTVVALEQNRVVRVAIRTLVAPKSESHADERKKAESEESLPLAAGARIS